MPFVPNVPGVPSLTSFLTAPTALVATDIALAFSQGLQSLQWGIYDQFGVPVLASALAPLFNLGPIGSTLNSVSGLLLGQQLINQISVVDFEYKQDWNISNYTVEDGGFQSYNKVQLPFDVRMRIAAGGNQTNRASVLTVVDNLANAGLTAGIPGLPAPVSSLLSGIGGTSLTSTVSNILSAPSLLSGVVSAITGAASAIPLFNVLTPEKIFTSCSVNHYDYKRTNINGVGILLIDIWLLQVRVTATSTFLNTQQPASAGQQTLGNVQPGSSQSLGSIAPQ